MAFAVDRRSLHSVTTLLQVKGASQILKLKFQSNKIQSEMPLSIPLWSEKASNECPIYLKTSLKAKEKK